MTGTRTRQIGVLVLLIALVLALAVALAIEGGPDGLPVPPPGTVAAAFVDDHPVFVVHQVEGGVTVLDAVSPHASFPKVLAWCESFGAFEDLWHGAFFTGDGTWLGGPAPPGMAAYEIIEADGDRVRVGGRSSPPPRPERGRVREGENWQVPGPRCDQRTALYGRGNEVDPAVVDDLVVHTEPPSDTTLWFPTRARILGEEPVVPPGIWEEP